MFKFLLKLLIFLIPFSTCRKSLRNKFLRDIKKENALNNNKLIVVLSNGKEEIVEKILGLDVQFCGRDSTVKIHEPYSFENSRLILGVDNFVEIKTTKYFINNFTMMHPMREHSSLLIGKDFSCMGCKCFLHDEPDTKVCIGDDCQFSFDVVIWPSDGHAILNENGDCINKGADIYIGNHVWLGMKTTVLKGANIPDNSIVGAHSLWVSSSNPLLHKGFGGGVYIGSPARITKSNVFWVRQNCYDYSQNFRA